MGQFLQALGGGRPVRADSGQDRDPETEGRAFPPPDPETRRVLGMLLHTLDRLPE